MLQTGSPITDSGRVTIQSLWAYPIKSCAGVRLDTAYLDQFGLAGDRRWMVVDRNGRMVTARTRPELLHVVPAIHDKTLKLSAPGMGKLKLSPPSGKSRLTVRIWHDQVAGVPCHLEGSQWFSDYLKQQVQLVWMDVPRRHVEPNTTVRPTPVAFADGFPLLVINQASITEIEQRLGTTIDIRRFRPNLVVQGAKAWEEDHWHALTSDTMTLTNVKPCARCQVICTDPNSLSSEPELLKRLASYRKTELGIIVGFNAIHDGPGQLRQNQTLTICPATH